MKNKKVKLIQVLIVVVLFVLLLVSILQAATKHCNIKYGAYNMYPSFCQPLYGSGSVRSEYQYATGRKCTIGMPFMACQDYDEKWGNYTRFTSFYGSSNCTGNYVESWGVTYNLDWAENISIFGCGE